MKLAVIGGGSTYTPELVDGIARLTGGIKITELVLCDPDADRLIVMYAGHLVETGPAEEVLGSPRHPYTQLLLSAVPDPKAELNVGAETDRGEPPKVINPAPGCRFRARCPLAIAICHEVTPRLAELAPGHSAASHVAQSGAEVKAF